MSSIIPSTNIFIPFSDICLFFEQFYFLVLFAFLFGIVNMDALENCYNVRIFFPKNLKLSVMNYIPSRVEIFRDT